MISAHEQQQQTVRLFVRADPELGCEAQKQSVIERLAALEAEGHIGSYDVHVWASEICPSGPLTETAYYQRIFEHLSAFRTWAREKGVSLDFAFKRTTLTCEMTGETYSVLSLPSMCLAVYEGDELCGVYPHCREGTLSTISDRLAALESSETERSTTV